jgi:hypothetical protein
MTEHEQAHTPGDLERARSAAQQSVWQDSFLLQRVFSYVGPGQWQFFGYSQQALQTEL